MVRGIYQRGVGVFTAPDRINYALNELQSAGFPMDRVSVAAQDRKDLAARRSPTSKDVDTGATTGAIAGTAVGSLLGLLEGLGALAIPGIGPIIVGGAVLSILATTLAGGAIGAAGGSIIGLLVGLGIPEERAKDYRRRLVRGETLVMVEGNPGEMQIAQTILSNAGVNEWNVYDIDPPQAPIVVTKRQRVEVNQRAVGVLNNYQETEDALTELKNAGFPMATVSAIARDSSERSSIADLGIPEEPARMYSDRLNRGNYLVIVDGTPNDIDRAEAILQHQGIQDWGIYHAPDSIIDN